MSGSTIGGVVGAAIGFWIGGGPQGAYYGWMVGSAVGGYVDPTQVYGPRLQDASQQTAMPGVYITRGWGTFRTAGFVLWQEPTVVEHERTQRQGKGGPEQVSYFYTRSHAIGICRGPITGILIAKENGKVVLDQRTDAVILAEYASAGITGVAAAAKLSEQRAQNAKFLANTTFYLGTEDQLPDPVMEEHEGVNNVPAYPSLVYMGREDPELVLDGAISQYEFVVVRDGTTSTGPASYSARSFSLDVLPFNKNAHGLVEPRKPGVTYEYAAVPYLSVWDDPAVVWHSTVDAAIAEVETRPVTGEPVLRGWSTFVGEIGNNGFGAEDTLYPWKGVANDANAFYPIGLVYSRYPASEEQQEFYYATQSATEAVWVATIRNLPGGSQFGSGVVYSGSATGNDETYNGNKVWHDIIIACRPVASCVSPVPATAQAIPDAPGSYVDANGNVYTEGSCSLEAGTFKVLGTLFHNSNDIGYGDSVVMLPQGPALRSDDADYSDEAYWTAAYNASVSAGLIPAGKSYSATGTDGDDFYPQLVSAACLCTPNYEMVAPEGVVLGTIVADLCRDEGLSEDEFDVSQLTDIVPGFRIASEGGADAAIDALQKIYLFDIGEWDGKVHFVKRGGTSLFAINGDDLIERDGDAFEVKDIQEFELLRSVTVGYSDPAAGYGPNTQKWERRTSLIETRGEASFELPITINADTAATAAKRKGMVAWGEPEKHKFSLPMRLSRITQTDVGTYTADDGEVRQVRVMQAEEDTGIRHMESATNAPEAYNATATGVAPKAPTITDVSVRGPTFAAYMNLPSLRTQDNVPGVTIAACGLLPGWAGAEILLSVDGGISYQPVATFTTPSTMGRLAADCTESSEPIDVRMNAGVLQSVTDEQLTLRRNAFAIKTNGVTELGQFKTATAAGSGAYALTNTVRGLLGTSAVVHAVGDPFVLVETAQFVPLDISLAGRPLYFKAVSFGTSQDAADAVPFVFNPLFTTVIVGSLTRSGETVTVSGQPIYVVIDNA